VLIVLVAVVGLAVAGIWEGFGWAVEQAVELAPAEWEVSLGRSAASQILAQKKVCADPRVTRAINEIGTRLVGGLTPSHYQFRVRVLDDPDVNAFALPGGYIFVNQGLIEQATDGFEVAGVLAHELQHVLLRHGMHNIARQAGLILILRTIMGDAGALEQFLMLNAAELAAMTFSRDQERAADIGGIELMYKTSMDPEGLPRFLDRIAAEQGTAGEILSILSTHPGSGERAKALRDIIASKPKPRITLLKFDLKEARGLCTPTIIEDPDSTI
jgi:predicted Zn-dependent protease